MKGILSKGIIFSLILLAGLKIGDIAIEKNGSNSSMESAMLSRPIQVATLYPSIVYTDLLKEESEYIGTIFCIEGEVLQVTNELDYIQVLIELTDKNTVLCNIHYGKLDYEDLQHAKVYIRGEFIGLKEYESMFTSTVEIPQFIAGTVEIQ